MNWFKILKQLTEKQIFKNYYIFIKLISNACYEKI